MLPSVLLPSVVSATAVVKEEPVLALELWWVADESSSDVDDASVGEL